MTQLSVNSHTANRAERVWATQKPARTSRHSIAERNAIALRHMNLVREIAHRMEDNCPEDYADLEQIGFMGLLKAVDRFEPHRGVAFSSFAVPYIKGAIQHFLRDHWGHVKVPRREIELSSRVRRVQRQMSALGREMDETQIARGIGVDGRKWQRVSDAVRRQPLICLDEVLCSEAPVEDAEQDGEHAWVRKSLARLPNPYRQALTERFFEGLSDQQIARKRKVELSVVRDWIGEGLARLKRLHEAMEANHG
jgi:RNA polymerase sigma-B factor